MVPALYILLAAIMAILGTAAPRPYGVPYFALTIGLAGYGLWLLIRERNNG